jgi:hypothetical protein
MHKLILPFVAVIFLSLDLFASLNSKFVYSQKLGSHIETVISKTKGLRQVKKTQAGYSFVFGGYLNGAPKIFTNTLYIFKEDRLIFINLYADNKSNKFGGPGERNKWTYQFYKNLTLNLKKNYGDFFEKKARTGDTPFCQSMEYYEDCNDSFFLEGKKKGIGIFIINSREVGLSYFDVEAVDELTYEKFLAEASRSLVSMRYAEIPLVPGQEIIQRKAPVNPNTAMSLKLD